MSSRNNFTNRFSNTLVTVTFIIFLTVALLFNAIFAISLLFGLSNYNPPDNSVGEFNNRVYKPTSEVVSPNKILPTLSDIGVEMQEYSHMSTAIDSNPFIYHSTLVLSTTDSVIEPTKLSTIVYEIFKSPIEPVLDCKEKALKKYYDNNFVDAEPDYGAKSAYWLEDNLVLRYDGQLLVIYSETSRSLIDNEHFANVMRNKLSAI